MLHFQGLVTLRHRLHQDPILVVANILQLYESWPLFAVEWLPRHDDDDAVVPSFFVSVHWNDDVSPKTVETLRMTPCVRRFCTFSCCFMFHHGVYAFDEFVLTESDFSDFLFLRFLGKKCKRDA